MLLKACHRSLLLAASAVCLCVLAPVLVWSQQREPPGSEPAANEAGDGAAPPERKSPTSAEDRRMMLVEKAIAAEDWQSAVEQLQLILDFPQDTIWRGVSFQAEAEARIGSLPAAGRDMYRAEYGPVAAQLLQSADGPDALRGAAVVANRYFHTDAGKQAAAKVASLLFDRGEYRAASIWYTRLTDEPGYRDSIDWRARATFALVQAGERGLAEPLLQSLAQQPAAPIVRNSDPNDTLATWILKQPSGSAETPELRDWLTIYGNAAHVGAAPPCEPLLLERWAQPHTARYATTQQIRSLMLDLRDNDRSSIPVLMPIVVGPRVAFRTFRGLAVLDAESGRLLWENDPDISAELQLANEPPRDVDAAPDFTGLTPEYGTTVFDQHPLATLLYRDAGYGQLSSDGSSVFSIENSVLMSPAEAGYSAFGNGTASKQDPYQRNWTSNQIHAYDLATGERLWEAGGRLLHEPMDPPLAGVFFFGPPVADGAELFAIGERDREILLFALSPTTGELLWSQSLMQANANVKQDLERRKWTCTPAVDAGMVVCPTGNGWIVAVDRNAHRIAWAHQFVQRPAYASAANNTPRYPQLPLNVRWCPSAPILAGGAVVFTPPEQPNESGDDQPGVLCLDARTGAERWRREKRGALYLAGVFDGQVLLVGRHSVESVKLGDGAPSWTVPIPPEDGPPSGRGIACGGQYLLPLQSGQLWTIDVADGRLARRSHMPNGETPLGNLAVWDGMLISQGPFGLVGFEQREALEDQIAQRLSADSKDLFAAVRQAEVHMAGGDYAAALVNLDRGDGGAVPDTRLKERHRTLSFQALLALLRSSRDERPDELERAAALASSDDERLELARLSVDRHIAAGRWDKAGELCQQIAGQFPNDRMIEEELTSLRLDVWLGGRLSEIAANAPAALGEALAAQIAATLENSSVEFPGAASLERIYGFHPAAQGYVWRLIEDAAFRRDFAGAEVRLRRLLNDGDRATQAAALARLGDLLVEFDQPADAAAAFARLETEFGEVVLPSLQTGAETARDRFSITGSLDRDELQPPVIAEWSREQFEIHHSRVNHVEYSVSQPPVMRRLTEAFFRRHLIEFDSQSPEMSIRQRFDNSLYWRVPLRATEAQAYNQAGAVIGQGLQMIVLHRGVVHAMSLPERRVLWSRPLAEGGPGVYSRLIYDNTSPNLLPAGGFAQRAGMTSSQSPTGMLALATSRYIACHGRGEFFLLDPLTGEVLWRRRGILPNSSLNGDDHNLYVVPSEADSAYMLRASDGRPLTVPAADQLPALVASTIAVTSHGLVRIDRPTGARRATPAKLTIDAYDPIRQTSAWSHQFSARCRMRVLEDRDLFVLDEESGDCVLIDLETGRRQLLGQAPAAARRNVAEMSVVADARQVYLVLNDADNNFNSYVQIPALRVGGTIVAFHRDGSGIAWQQRVDNQNLLLPQFEQAPLLVFAAYDLVHLPDLDTDYANVRLLALDKGDGHVVVEDKRASPNGSYYRINLDREERVIDILAYNERVRIQPIRPPE